ncbi:MAG: hypothetical protein HY055_08875 [Magnetospirillum sp.]|nr:hypothetical protein [Magnetospirillum sp.]
MTCIVAQENASTVFRLVGQLDDQDFDRIESGFDQVVDCPNAVVIFDFAGLERISASIVALVGVLRLQAYRVGTKVELRNISREFSEFLSARG